MKIYSFLLGILCALAFSACSAPIDVNDPSHYCWVVYDAAQSHPVNRYEWCTSEEILQKIDFYNANMPQPCDYKARKTLEDSQPICEHNNFYE